MRVFWDGDFFFIVLGNEIKRVNVKQFFKVLFSAAAKWKELLRDFFILLPFPLIISYL